MFIYLSVVAPCYNEQEVLPEFSKRLIAAVHDANIDSFEVILVDDGSTDKTWQAIASLAAANKRIKAIKLSRNFGHQAALTAGLKKASGEYIFIIDSDLQDPPELLKEMISKAKSGFDVVYGQRRQRAGESFFKKASAKAFYRILSMLADVNIPKDTGDFRLINNKVLQAYNSLTESQRFTRGLIAWLGFKQVGILYDRHSRFAGTSKYPLKKMINFSIDAITGYSLKPLRFILVVGVYSALISSMIFIYTIYGWLFMDTIPGWASIMTAVTFLSSVQLICIGMVGEYVGRILVETKRRPLFLIEEQIND